MSTIPGSNFYLMVNGTIDSCTYPYIDNVYIRYSVTSGSDWQLVDGIEYGISQICKQQSLLSKLLNGINSNGGVMNINYPVELIYKSTNVYGWPQLVISVYTINKFGATDSICGYTTLHIPTQPGIHTRSCTLYRPIDSTPYQKIISLFTNKKPEFIDPIFLTQSKGRELTRVQSCGTITLTFNVLTRSMNELGYHVNNERINSLYNNDKYLAQQELTDEQIAVLHQRKSIMYSKPSDLPHSASILQSNSNHQQQQHNNNIQQQSVHPISTQSAAQQQQLNPQPTQQLAEPHSAVSPTNGLKSLLHNFTARQTQPTVNQTHVNLTTDNASIHQNIPQPTPDTQLPVLMQTQSQFPVIRAASHSIQSQLPIQPVQQPIISLQPIQQPSQPEVSIPVTTTDSLVNRFRKPNLNDNPQPEQNTNDTAQPSNTDPISSSSTITTDAVTTVQPPQQQQQQRPTFDQTLSLHKQQAKHKPSLMSTLFHK